MKSKDFFNTIRTVEMTCQLLRDNFRQIVGERDAALARVKELESGAAQPTIVKRKNWNNLFPTSKQGIELAAKLPELFGPKELIHCMGLKRNQTPYWLLSWKRKGWIELCKYAQYRKTDRFGQFGTTILTQATQPSKKTVQTITLTDAANALLAKQQTQPVQRPVITPKKPAQPKPVDAFGETGLRVGRGLTGSFSATDLAARLDAASLHDATNTAYRWLSLWKHKGWIETVGFMLYQKTANFGKP